MAFFDHTLFNTEKVFIEILHIRNVKTNNIFLPTMPIMYQKYENKNYREPPSSNKHSLFSFSIKCIAMPLVNKITQVSSIQIYNVSSVYCIACSPPKVTHLSSNKNSSQGRTQLLKMVAIKIKSKRLIYILQTLLRPKMEKAI